MCLHYLSKFLNHLLKCIYFLYYRAIINWNTILNNNRQKWPFWLDRKKDNTCAYILCSAKNVLFASNSMRSLGYSFFQKYFSSQRIQFVSNACSRSCQKSHYENECSMEKHCMEFEQCFSMEFCIHLICITNRKMLRLLIIQFIFLCMLMLLLLLINTNSRRLCCFLFSFGCNLKTQKEKKIWLKSNQSEILCGKKKTFTILMPLKGHTCVWKTVNSIWIIEPDMLATLLFNFGYGERFKVISFSLLSTYIQLHSVSGLQRGQLISNYANSLSN